MPMQVYEVGKLYVPGRTRWPESTEYNFRDGQQELRVFLARPSRGEIQAVASAPLYLAAIVELPVILLGFRFSPTFKGTAPYSWHLVPEFARVPPPLNPVDEGPILHVYLVDATTGILLALRMARIPADVANALHEAIFAQSAQPWNAAEYDRRLEVLYREDNATLIQRAIASGTCR
jgi:hypothetical protein